MLGHQRGDERLLACLLLHADLLVPLIWLAGGAC
jgi:hypothetical protein